MKENFKETLDVFKKAAKKEKPMRLINTELKKEKLEEMIPESARLDVLRFQKEKQAVMDWLRENLKRIDDNEGVQSFTSKTEKPYVVDGEMTVACEDGTLEKVTTGMLATDGEWGLEYQLEKDVPRDVKKKFIIAEAKREIFRLLNYQMSVTETKREIPKWMDGAMKIYMGGVKGGYAGVMNEASIKDHTENWGLVAEKLVSTLMEMLQFDEKLPFSFVTGDAFDDYERKIDFYIHIPSHVRGVKSQTEERKDVGIQFYGGSRSEHKSEKRKQISESKKRFGLGDIDDIVLVSIPLNEVNGLYQKWLAGGKKPGGVTKLLTEESKKKIFYGVLQNFFEEVIIDEMWTNRKYKATEETSAEELMEEESETVSAINIEGADPVSNRVKNWLKVPVPSEKTKKKIEREKRSLEQSIKGMSKVLDLDTETESKIKQKEYLLEVLEQAFPSENFEEKPKETVTRSSLSAEQRDKDKISKLMQSIRDLSRNKNPSEKTEKKIQREKQQLALLTKEFLEGGEKQPEQPKEESETVRKYRQRFGKK